MKIIQSTDAKTIVVFSTMHARLKNFFDDSSAKENVLTLLEETDTQLWLALFPVEREPTGKSFKPVVMYSNKPDLRNRVKYIPSS